MKIEHYSFPDGIWEHEGTWRCTLNINDVKDAYMLYIEKNKIDYEIFHEESQYSKEETEKLIKHALENKEIQKELKQIKQMINEVKEILKKDSIEPKLKSYKIDEHWETFTFSIENENILFEYMVANDDNTEIYSTLTYLNKYHMDQIDGYFSKEFNQNVIEEIRKQPKARIRKMFKK